ncbi:MAG: DUF721 domain-containing protein [Gammaproteobacteria bacterium]|nr:DUF721 domain-containing protein [Gammaproteobacteria bacterium]
MTQRRTPDSINKLLSQGSGKLAKLQHKAYQLQVINRIITAELLPGSEEYCRVANLRNGTLVLEVASGAWFTRLQSMRINLLNQLRERVSSSLISIEVKVNPALFVTKPEPKPNQRKISAQTAEHLSALAQHSPPELAEILLRLAKLARRND